MISGHAPNPIFFNKKIKIGRPEHSIALPITSYCCLAPPLLEMEVICVSPLKDILKAFDDFKNKQEKCMK